MAASFDQDFKKDGNNAAKAGQVRMVPAKVTAVGPTDFNIGTLSMMKVYMSKADSTDEVLVASHTDTTLLVGNSMALVLIIQTF